MKSLIVLFALFVYVAAQGQRYRPVVAGPESAASILRQSSELNPDGTYQWSYETDNGIAAQEQGKGGDPQGTQAQGSFQYTAPDGTPIALQYIADENGFQPEGSHLPIPPPIPDAILRSIEWNAAHPDGTQRPPRF